MVYHTLTREENTIHRVEELENYIKKHNTQKEINEIMYKIILFYLENNRLDEVTLNNLCWEYYVNANDMSIP